MAKLIGNIIHLDPRKDIGSELREGYAVKLENESSSILIIENEILDDFTYYMQVEGGENGNNRYGKVDYFEAFFNEKISRADFISLGTWNNKILENELRSRFVILTEEGYDNQNEFMIKKSDELITYIRNSYDWDERGIRWFNFGLVKDKEHKNCELNCAHHGEEMYCFNIPGTRVHNLIEAVDRSTSSAFIRVQREGLDSYETQ